MCIEQAVQDVFGLNGKAITFVTPNEHEFLAGIEDYIGFKIPTMPLPTSEEVFDQQISFEKR